MNRKLLALIEKMMDEGKTDEEIRVELSRVLRRPVTTGEVTEAIRIINSRREPPPPGSSPF